MTRPELHEAPLNEAIRPGHLTVTMSPGQWDALLAASYDLGATLLEIDGNEQPTRAYRKTPPTG